MERSTETPEAAPLLLSHVFHNLPDQQLGVKGQNGSPSAPTAPLTEVFIDALHPLKPCRGPGALLLLLLLLQALHPQQRRVAARRRRSRIIQGASRPSMGGAKGGQVPSHSSSRGHGGEAVWADAAQDL